jgi:hypothetical protein
MDVILRRRVWAVGSVVAALVVAASVLVVTLHHADPAPVAVPPGPRCVKPFQPTLPSVHPALPALQLSPEPSLLPTGRVVAPADAAPDGGGLRIVEIGHSPLPPQNGLFQLSVGVVVENTSMPGQRIGVGLRTALGSELPSRSPYCLLLAAHGAGASYRDASGRVIGGRSQRAWQLRWLSHPPLWTS